ncbi:MAG: type II toxin-antitoxin system RelE/ParE family toxin [Deltaproteobacteria bacterium]
MRVVRWAPGAVQDLVRLRGFLGHETPGAAARAALRIREAAAVLRNRPEIGSAIEDEEFRDLAAPSGGGAYVLRHRIDEDAVVVVRGTGARPSARGHRARHRAGGGRPPAGTRARRSGSLKSW